jgi:ABC-type sulfate/molybdate transport systems ATPase subunit
MEFLSVVDLSHQISDISTLKAISLSLSKYEKVVVAGETGSGKSTLLKVIAGLVQPRTGDVFFQGQRVQGPAEKLIPGHPNIAYLSQHFELAKFLRVEQVLSYANSLSQEKAEAIFAICQIENLRKRKTDELSGGERQRIALARLLIGSPKLLLLDEPFSNLDLVHKQILKNVIEAIGDELGITIVLVSHDPDDTLPWADRIFVMRHGSIVQSGTSFDIYNDPVDAYVAGLFGKFTEFDETLQHAFRADAGVRSGVVFKRPEQLRIVDSKNGGVQCVVESCEFFGSHFEIVAKIQGLPVIVRSKNPIDPGSVIGLQIAPRD